MCLSQLFYSELQEQQHFMKTIHLPILKELKPLFPPLAYQFFSESWSLFTGSQISGNKGPLQLQQSS